MKSELSDLYKVIIREEPDFFSDCNEEWLSEIKDYIKYNYHNTIIEGNKRGLNYSNRSISRIDIYPLFVSVVEGDIPYNLEEYFPKKSDNDEEINRISFIINKYSSISQNVSIRLNKKGLFIEIFSNNPENFNKNYNITTYIYDWVSIHYIQSTLGFKLGKGRRIPDNELLFEFYYEMDISSITPENILKEFNVEPDTIMEFNSSTLTCSISNTIMTNKEEFDIEKYSEDESFYATYMQYMIKEGYYFDKSIEMQLEQKIKALRRNKYEQ